MALSLPQRPQAGCLRLTTARCLGVVLCLAALLSFAISAEALAGNVVSFGAPTSITTAANPNSVATGDFNGDGDLDLAVANSAAASVSILTGGLGGTFSAPNNIPIAGGATAVAVGDFNFDADKDPDLAVVGTGGTVTTLLGSTGSLFSTGQTMTAGQFPTAVAIADFSADGEADIAVANQGGDNLSIFAGADAARFIPTPTTVSAGDGPNAIAVGDFNGDSDPDLAVANQGQTSASANDTVSILTGGTGLAFAGPTNFTVGDFPQDVTTADFNADGDLDLAVANRGSGTTGPLTTTILTGTGTGASFVTSSTLAGGGRAVRVGDFNEDGDADLAAGGASVNLSVFVGAGGATFGAAQNFALGGDVLSVAVGDWDKDGLHDVAGANYFNARVTTAVNTSDLVAPNTTIDSGPSGLTNDSTPTFTFSSNEAGSTFQCRLEGGRFLPCTSPLTLPTQTDGPHSLEVLATDAAGNVDPSAATRSFTVDTVAPSVSITGGPTGTTGDSTPTFTFSGEAGATVQCRVDTNVFAGCASPHTTATLTNGAHTFEVRATDAAGNAASATRSFTVDTAAPSVSITGGPAGPTNDNTPQFTFTAEAGATVQCRVDTNAFAACTSPHTTAQLTDGAHTFEVRATDAVGNFASATRSFTVDTVAPDATLTAGPSGSTLDTTPTFEFNSDDASATFQCRVDGGEYAPCTSPHTTAALALGVRTFDVRAVDAAGNVDATHASRSFTVAAPAQPDRTPPDTRITAGPTGSTGDTTPTFEFSSTEVGSRFECKLDDSPFIPCKSPLTLPPLSPGPHTFQVRAIDAAGNVDASPASAADADAALRTFTVAAQALARPVLGKRFNVEPVKGLVYVSVPAGTARASTSVRASVRVPGIKGREFVPLREARQVAVGSILDTRKGTVRLTSARNSTGATQSGEFNGGVFQVLQSGKRSAKGLTDLALKGSSFKGCRASGKKASAAASRRRIRRLRGSGRGRFRTRGRYSAATVRGTIWTVTDRCDGTLTKVTRGRVAVRDNRRRKTIVLRAGRSYLARAR